MKQTPQSKPKKAHKLTEKFPVLSALLFAFAGFILCQTLSSLINMPIHVAFNAYSMTTGIAGTLIASFVILLLYKLFFKPEFEGNLKGGSLALGFQLGVFHIAYLVISLLLPLLLFSSTLKAPSFAQTEAAIMAGVTEELAFRALLIGTLMRQWHDEKKILPAVIISGVVFALIHAANIFAGADPFYTAGQVFSAGCGGVFFAAVYLRSGNILPVMVLHTIQDICAAAATAGATDTLIVTTSIRETDILDMVLSAVLAGVGIWLVRGKVRPEILNVWNRKWTVQ